MSKFDYVAEAKQTLSPKFYAENVAFTEFRDRLTAFARAGQSLDVVKKALFYGKGDPVGPTRGLNVRLCDAARDNLGAGLRPDHAETVIHGVVGIATEAGELVEALHKATHDFSTGIDRTNVKEELGDLLWYVAILCDVFGFTFEDIQRTNIAKLRERFPHRFTEYDANNRDLEAERRVLEGVTSDYVETEPQRTVDEILSRSPPAHCLDGPLPVQGVTSADIRPKAFEAPEGGWGGHHARKLALDSVGNPSEFSLSKK